MFVTFQYCILYKFELFSITKYFELIILIFRFDHKYISQE